jgi:hypothetical protein
MMKLNIFYIKMASWFEHVYFKNHFIIALQFELHISSQHLTKLTKH